MRIQEKETHIEKLECRIRELEQQAADREGVIDGLKWRSRELMEQLDKWKFLTKGLKSDLQKCQR
jgi:hypothetical protein